MDNQKKEMAAKLLKIKAIKLQPQEPFTWASGWKSPIYCDNRKVNSYPEVRTYVKLVPSRKVRWWPMCWDCPLPMCVRSPRTTAWEIR